MQDQITHKNNTPSDEFLMQEANIIDENNTILNVGSYFNVDHELE
jgi:hypothetical protein